MRQIKFYCVTDKKINFINKENYNFGWVGNEDVPESYYITCALIMTIYFTKKNIILSLTFHYWFWKNLMIR